jgi:asparagine synthase (glutamine-hydrolysing)
MCGIAGYLSHNQVGQRVLPNMMEAIRHRGPDSNGIIDAHPFHGGIQRLSINDPLHGDQPLYNQARTVSLIYNGEIYNSPALRKDLEKKGYVFRTKSDGEVICHLYDEMGEALFEQLDGMFAIAIWDRLNQKLLLARDIPGEKPLYFAKLTNGSFAFASTIQAVAQYPNVDLSLDYQSIWDLPTFSWIVEPDTIYKGIKALPRGHFAVVTSSGMKVSKIRNIFESESFAFSNIDEAVTVVREQVELAVRSRLLSDVQVGSFLSGGLDSSIIASIAARELDDIEFFSVGFENTIDPHHGMADESYAAAAFAKQLGRKHHIIRATPQSFKSMLDDFCLYSDQPFSVSSGLGILAVSSAARDEGIKVLLSGDGADECFGGYSWYSHLDSMGKRTGNVNDSIISYNNTGLSLEERLNHMRTLNDTTQAWAWHYYAHEAEKNQLFARDFLGEVKTSMRHFEGYKKENWSPSDYIKQDRLFYLPMEMMRKLDLMTMANSVEGRAPFVAPRILALAEQIPYEFMVNSNGLKFVLRAAFKDILPDDVVKRPKHGFNVPLDHWFRGHWRGLLEETFSMDSELYKNGIIDKKSRDIAIRISDDESRVSGHTLLSFVTLNRWLGLI